MCHTAAVVPSAGQATDAGTYEPPETTAGGGDAGRGGAVGGAIASSEPEDGETDACGDGTSAVAVAAWAEGEEVDLPGFA